MLWPKKTEEKLNEGIIFWILVFIGVACLGMKQYFMDGGHVLGLMALFLTVSVYKIWQHLFEKKGRCFYCLQFVLARQRRIIVEDPYIAKDGATFIVKQMMHAKCHMRAPKEEKFTLMPPNENLKV